MTKCPSYLQDATAMVCATAYRDAVDAATAQRRRLVRCTDIRSRVH
eukprot:COSAG01_NODE_15389_length_1344_cov_0.867470_4_plen_45_part_01